jgi:hypothetical protein
MRHANAIPRELTLIAFGMLTMRIMDARALLGAVFLAAAVDSPAGPPAFGGTKPSYVDQVTESAPNVQAIARRIWVPGLEEGYVPQGLTVAEGDILVSAYLPEPGGVIRHCRVFRLDPASGKTTGSFELPHKDCLHAGGLAYLGKGLLLLSDTRRLFRIELAKALASGRAEGAMRWFDLSGEWRGSFAGFDGTHAWIGRYAKESRQARMYRFDPKLFDDAHAERLTEERALETIAIPVEAQGLAFDARGDPWVSASHGSFGRLYHLDRAGTVRKEYEMVPGLEDIEFDAAGRLWSLSESGSRKYFEVWATRFPFVFEIDVSKLR